jgi:hypothetical protein
LNRGCFMICVIFIWGIAFGFCCYFRLHGKLLPTRFVCNCVGHHLKPVVMILLAVVPTLFALVRLLFSSLDFLVVNCGQSLILLPNLLCNNRVLWYITSYFSPIIVCLLYLDTCLSFLVALLILNRLLFS